MASSPDLIKRRLEKQEAKKAQPKFWIGSTPPPKGAWVQIVTGLPDMVDATVPGARMRRASDGTRRLEEIDPGGRRVRYVDVAEVEPPVEEAPVDVHRFDLRHRDAAPAEATTEEPAPEPAPVPTPRPLENPAYARADVRQALEEQDRRDGVDQRPGYGGWSPYDSGIAGSRL